MWKPGPDLSRLFAIAALALGAGAWAPTLAKSSGASPLVLALGACLVLPGLVIPGPRAVLASAPGRLLVLAMLPFGVLVAPRASLPGAQLSLGSVGLVPLLVGALACLGLGWLAGPTLRATARPGRPLVGLLDGLVALAALSLAAMLPPVASAALAASSAALVANAPRAARLPARTATEPARLLGLALALGGAAWVFVGLRPICNPAPAGFLVALGGLALGAALTRGASTERAARAPAIGAASLLLAQVLLWKAPGLARVLVLLGTAEAGPLPAWALRASPLVLGAILSGALLGLAWGPRPSSGATALALPAGLLLLPHLVEAPERALWLAILIPASSLLWTLDRGAQLLGAGVAAAAIALAIAGEPPAAQVLAAPAWNLTRSAEAAQIDAESRAGTTTVLAALSPQSGSVELRVPSDRWDEGRAALEPGPLPVLVANVDGITIESQGRAAEAEALGGHLAGLLAADRSRVLVLGDDLGRGLAALLEHPVDEALVACPEPRLVRSLAGLDPARRAHWLDPRARLVASHPEQLLREETGASAILEVMRAPWADAQHSRLSPDHLAAVQARLRPDGVYVLVLHLGWFPGGSPAQRLAPLARRFDRVQVWLPPFGADSVVLVASDGELPLDRLAERLPEAPGMLASVGVASLLDLASLAVGDGASLGAWAEAGADPPSASAHDLGPAVVARPTLHLADFADHIAQPALLWPDASATDLVGLETRRGARASFLRLLGEATTGDMEAVFRRARELQAAEATVGTGTLEPLIDPHLKDARRAIARGQAEGLGSGAWDEALRFATTARMLAPTSPRPLVVLGEIALGQGQVNAARNHFEQALSLAPEDLPALTGLSRTARSLGDAALAERSLRETTRLAPENWRTWQNLGVLLKELGRSEEAEQALRMALLHSAGTEPEPHLALAELMLDTGRAEAGLRTANDAIAVRETGLGWTLRGRAHYDLGRLDLAGDDFQRAVLLDPDLADARLGTGLVLAGRGELEQAGEAFRAVLRLRPDDAAARENLRRVDEELAATAPDPAGRPTP